VNGLAYGVDITIQKAAMNHGLQTIACLAHGLNQIYPKAHKKFASKM
jgi:DNA processing protein